MVFDDSCCRRNRRDKPGERRGSCERLSASRALCPAICLEQTREALKICWERKRRNLRGRLARYGRRSLHATLPAGRRLGGQSMRKLAQPRRSTSQKHSTPDCEMRFGHFLRRPNVNPAAL
jgi:hypothetical protein